MHVYFFGISSDGDDRRNFFRLEILEPGFFLGTNIWQVFLGWLDLKSNFR